MAAKDPEPKVREQAIFWLGQSGGDRAAAAIPRALVEVLRPEKRVYTASGQSMTEAAIDTRLTGDLYVSLGEPVTPDGVAGAWGVRIYVKPFVDWIWGGCLLMALGGFLAIADRRYRIKVRERVGAAFAAARA
mgnify:CR=1 FL=1